LAGWVRNLPDGRVEVCAMGSGDKMTSLALAIEKGPSLAAVELVEKSDAPPEVAGFKSFDIR